jgi:3,4-dihydroxy 2-butanone 4-phosphate synthase/GTP cyclohydrolase II
MNSAAGSVVAPGSLLTDQRVLRAVEELRAGGAVVVTDDADRENEGDLVIAAQFVSDRWIAFMMTECRGLICVPVTAARAAELDLPPMVERNAEAMRTAFTVSVDADAGVTTGISARDRAATIHALWHPDSTAADLVRPGHVFPLIAHEGGVLARQGHTEAAIDLALLGGLSPAGVICEIAGSDGEMLRGVDLEDFALSHGLPMVSIAELFDYRNRA